MSRFKTTGLLSQSAGIESDAPPLRDQVLIATLLASFVAATYGFGIYLFAQLVTDMRADLGFDYGSAGAITAAGQAGFLVFAAGAAWLSPRLGGGQVVVGSIVLCGLCLVLLPKTGNIYLLGALLTIMSGTAASVWVPMVEIVARVFAYRHRGKVLGLASSGTSYGVFIGSMLVPGFVAAGNWRGVWYSVGTGTLVISALAIVAFWRLGLFRRQALQASLEPNSNTKAGNLSRLARGATIPGWIIMVWAITFLNGLSALPFQTYLAPYLREELGFHVQFAAQVWALIGFIGMFAGFLMGWVSDKSGVRAALLSCYASVLLSSGLLIFWPHGTAPLLSGLLFALAFYPIFGLVPAYVAKMAPGSRGTLVFGVANVTLGLGGMVGNYAGGALKEATGTFIWVYAGAAIVSAILMVLSFSLPRESESGGSEQRAKPPSNDSSSSPSQVSGVATKTFSEDRR